MLYKSNNWKANKVEHKPPNNQWLSVVVKVVCFNTIERTKRSFLLMKYTFNIWLVGPHITACTSINSHCCQVNSGNCPFSWWRLFYWVRKSYSRGVYKTCSKNYKWTQAHGCQVKCSSLIGMWRTLYGISYSIVIGWSQIV